MLNKENMPIHIGIIMDGNGRWATQKNLPRTSGHKEGLAVAKSIIKEAGELGIKYITLYMFSTENWKRTQEEVGYLMNLIKANIRAEFNFYKKNGLRIEHIGDLEGLPMDVQKEIIQAKEDTKNIDGTTVVIAINYGGRDEITRAVKKLTKENLEVTEENISKCMDIPELPDVDLLIRTGGELRLSNFLLWQASYAELIFSKTLWPDYTIEEFHQNIEDFQNRKRRFGSA